MPTRRELDTPEFIARFLASLKYPEGEIMDVLSRDFPGADIERIYAEAQQRVCDSEAEVDALIAAEEQAAIAAEHDLGQTMHGQ